MNLTVTDRSTSLYLVTFAINILVNAMFSLRGHTSELAIGATTALATLAIAIHFYKEMNLATLETVAEKSIDGVTGLLILDRKLKVLRVNQEFTRTSGFADQHVQNRYLFDLASIISISHVEKIKISLSKGGSWRGDYSGIDRFGGNFTVELSIKTIKNVFGYAEKYVVTFVNITRRKAHEERLSRLIETDPLTQLWNRRRFDKEIAHYSQLSKRLCMPKACLAILDIDHFKKINDCLGHEAGDRALSEVAQLLQSNCRETDLVFRIGGEEFAIIMPETTLHQAFEAMYRLKDSVTVLSQLSITLSCGISEILESDQAFFHADKALYQAKSDGRNRVSSAPEAISEDGFWGESDNGLPIKLRRDP